MTEKQRELIEKEIILLDKMDVIQITGWSDNIVRDTFAYDNDFPAIKKGKKYQVELGALKNYLKSRRTNIK